MKTTPLLPDRLLDAGETPVLTDLTAAAQLPTEDIALVLAAVTAEEARLAAVKAILAARLAEQANTHSDRLFGIKEAAARLATTPDWLRRNGELPFVVRLSPGQVRYSEAGIERFIRRRQRP